MHDPEHHVLVPHSPKKAIFVIPDAVDLCLDIIHTIQSAVGSVGYSRVYMHAFGVTNCIILARGNERLGVCGHG